MTCSSVFRTIGLGSTLLWIITCPPASVRGQNYTTIVSFNGTNGAARYGSGQRKDGDI